MDVTGIGRIASFAENLVDRFFPPDASPEQKAKIAADNEEGHQCLKKF